MYYNSLPDYVIPCRKPKYQRLLQAKYDENVVNKPRPVTAAPLKPHVNRAKVLSKTDLSPIIQEKESPIIIIKTEPAPEVKKDEVVFSVHNIDNEELVVGACVILRESSEIELEKFTDLDGKCSVPLEKLIKTRLIINHNDYFGIVEEYGGDEGIDIKKTIKNMKKKIYLIPRPASENDVQLRFLPGNGVKCVQFSVLTDGKDQAATDGVILQSGLNGKEVVTLKNVLQKKGTVYRIVAKILPKKMDEFLHPDSTFMLSRYEGCESISIMTPPLELMDENGELHWDIGFFADPKANPQFFEINGFSKKELKYNSHLDEFQTLMTGFGNLDGNLKKLLGYTEDNSIERDGDIFVSKRNVYASINKYGLKGKNIDHLLLSARASDGVYSYKECERKFGSLKPPYNFVPYRKLGSLASIHDEEDK